MSNFQSAQSLSEIEDDVTGQAPYGELDQGADHKAMLDAAVTQPKHIPPNKNRRFEDRLSQMRKPEEPPLGIALALGGGAARGWAHIGVLRAFEDAGIRISMVAGTSIGALVGGCYLAGKLDALEEFARSITRTNMLRYMDFTFRGSGLISGSRLAQRMAEHLDGVCIEQLDRPFVTIAADIVSGHEVWLKDGPIIEAIRSSYALPGVFRPVRNGNRILVDGAIVNPVPVSACRAFEPKAVVAVNLNTEIFGKATVVQPSQYDRHEPQVDEEAIDQINHSWLNLLSGFSGSQSNKAANLGITGVMMESFNIIQDRIARSRLAGDPPDLTIRPLLKDIGLTEFHRADEAIELGYVEGVKRIRELEDQHAITDDLRVAI